MPRIALVIAFVIAAFFSQPLHAQTAAATAPVAATDTGNAPPSDARVAKMRERWKKMTPEQRDDMRKKADRRLQERFERLSPEQQKQVTGLIDQVIKLDREQRSIVLARIHQKFYEERAQKKAMKEQENKGTAAATPEAKPEATPAAAPTATAPAAAPAVATPAVPASKPASKPASP